MSAPRERPGAKARELLGGDERLHVFVSPEAAQAYLMRIPGSRVYAPRRAGMGCVLDDAISGSIRARDLVVQLHHPRESRGMQLALEIAVALYDRGALEVRDANGALIRMPERTQTWRGAR